MPRKAASSKPVSKTSKPARKTAKPVSKASRSKAQQAQSLQLAKELERAGVKVLRQELTPHLKVAFRSQTIYIAGNSYVNCTFQNCTFVVTNSAFRMTDCNASRCNWRIEIDVLSGDPQSHESLRTLMRLIDGTVAPKTVVPRTRPTAAKK